jgi:uncharacterized protein (TIGR03083 family)
MASEPPDPANDRMPSGEEMLRAYLDAANRFIAAVRQAGEPAAATPVPACPAWNVRDMLAHVTSVARLSAFSLPWGDDPQVTVDREVAARADRTLAGIADEWQGLLPAVEKKFAGNGPGPLVVDVVIHEHDLRAALGPAYRDHAAGLDAALPATVAWVRYLGLVGDPGIVLRTPTSRVLFGGPAVGCEVVVPDDWELLRLLGVRRSAEQLEAHPCTGDRSLLYAVTSRYPLPAKPLETEG